MEVVPIIWTVAGILLIIAEFAVGGMVIFFCGISALIVGIAMFFGLATGGGLPYATFGVLTVLQVLFLRRYFKSWFKGDEVPDKIEAGELEEYVGRHATVLSGFEDGSTQGKVEFKGAQWSATATGPVKLGDRVEIIDRDSLHLTIKPSDS